MAVAQTTGSTSEAGPATAPTRKRRSSSTTGGAGITETRTESTGIGAGVTLPTAPGGKLPATAFAAALIGAGQALQDRGQDPILTTDEAGRVCRALVK